MKTPLFTLAALALAFPALAAGGSGAGSSSTPKSGSSSARGSSPPGESKLPRSSGVGTSIATTPFAWVDDATILPQGGAAFSTAVVSWQGTDGSETDAPVVGVAAGVLPRFQLSARVPYVVGNATTGLQSGFGTSYVSGKIALVQTEGDGFKLSIAPTLQLLGTNIVLPTTDSRAQWGVPVSMEVDRTPARMFASAGYFSGGVGFAGGGVSVDVTRHVALSGSVSYAWVAAGATVPTPSTLGTDRTEVSGGASYAFGSHAAIFGSIGQTIGTTDANGAGMTVVGGILIVGQPVHR